MLIVLATIIVIVAFCWRLNRGWLAAERRRAEEEPDLVRHDHARAHERAQVEAEGTRWSGPH